MPRISSFLSSPFPVLLFSAINSILHNENWYRKKNVIDFISRVGRQVRLGDMLSRTSVKERIKSEEGMSFSEFSYQIFQAYDWLYLRDKYNCCIQVINFTGPLLPRTICLTIGQSESFVSDVLFDLYAISLPPIRRWGDQIK